MTWYVFRCPKCNNWGVRELRDEVFTDKSFVCKICGKSTRIKKRKNIGLNIDYKGGYADQYTALAVITQIKSNNKEQEDFFEYKRK